MGHLVSWQVNGNNVGGWQVVAVRGEGRQVGGSVRLALVRGGVCSEGLCCERAESAERWSVGFEGDDGGKKEKK